VVVKSGMPQLMHIRSHLVAHAFDDAFVFQDAQVLCVFW